MGVITYTCHPTQISKDFLAKQQSSQPEIKELIIMDIAMLFWHHLASMS